MAEGMSKGIVFVPFISREGECLSPPVHQALEKKKKTNKQG